MSTSTIVSILFVAAFVALGLFAYRNMRVFMARERIRKAIFAQNMAHIDSVYGNDAHTDAQLDQLSKACAERWNVIKSVSYDGMLLKFWQPVGRMERQMMKTVEAIAREEPSR